MSWGSVDQAGLVFLACCRDSDTFVAHGRRVVGLVAVALLMGALLGAVIYLILR